MTDLADINVIEAPKLQKLATFKSRLLDDMQAERSLIANDSMKKTEKFNYLKSPAAASFNDRDTSAGTLNFFEKTLKNSSVPKTSLNKTSQDIDQLLGLNSYQREKLSYQ